jgi:hypothetical protein
VIELIAIIALTFLFALLLPSYNTPQQREEEGEDDD